MSKLDVGFELENVVKAKVSRLLYFESLRNGCANV